jgi:phosphatidylethanolamine-binding protein (PEBP) family uncharacterized protein
VHWTAFGIPGRATSVPANVAGGENSGGHEGWTPPCPPKGDGPHRYVFTLVALSRPLAQPDGASLDDVRRAASSDALARGQLTGRYRR